MLRRIGTIGTFNAIVMDGLGASIGKSPPYCGVTYVLYVVQ